MHNSLLCGLVITEVTNCINRCCEHPCVCHLLELEFLGWRTRACVTLINVALLLALVIDSCILTLCPDRPTRGFGHREHVCRKHSVAGFPSDRCSGSLLSPLPLGKEVAKGRG